jgi:hypothetical protein
MADLPPITAKWFKRMSKISKARALELKHYAVAMGRVFEGAAARLRPRGTAVFVVGNSSWNGEQLPTSVLFAELASSYFEFEDHLKYPLANRYMSYHRHNGADISEEHILVFRKRRSRKSDPSGE